MVPELLPVVADRDRRRLLARIVAAGLLPFSLNGSAFAVPGRRRLRAHPGNYRALLRGLRAGDTLELAPGEYPRGLPVHHLIGTPTLPIVIEGPAPPARAVFPARAGANTVSIVESAYVEVRRLRLDGRGLAVDAVKAEGHSAWAHHIGLERLEIVDHGASQQTIGISTKCPAWGWVVRDNTIVGAGTGMYFGDSDGSDPFFGSVIEGNRIVDPTGYAIQIKHQIARPEAAEGANDESATVIRRNVLVKTRAAAAPELARPSLLVGHWPLAGPGARDRYLIYGNLLFDNPSEALFQGEGNIALYNNLLFNPRGEGVRIQPHNHQPRDVLVFQNTIVAARVGLSYIEGEAGYERLFERNLIAGAPPVAGPVAGDNRLESYDNAASLFARFDTDLERIDLTPRSAAEGPRGPIDRRLLELPDAGLDFLGKARRGLVYGACGPAGNDRRACR